MEGISDEGGILNIPRRGEGGRKFWILNFFEPFGKIKGRVKFNCVKRPFSRDITICGR